MPQWAIAGIAGSITHTILGWGSGSGSVLDEVLLITWNVVAEGGGLVPVRHSCRDEARSRKSTE